MRDRGEIRYCIKRPPITKKNSQQILMNKKTGRPFIMPSRKYREYEEAAIWHLYPKPQAPIDYPVNVQCVFYMPTLRLVDLTNLLEAAADVLVHAGILADDNSRIVVAHDGSRVSYDKLNPRTEITITPLDVDQQMDLFWEG